MVQVSNRYKPLHQRFSELDNAVISAFCDSFSNVSWIADFKDGENDFCGIDAQLTATTKNGKKQTYDVEIKSRVTQDKWYSNSDCFFEWEKWYSLIHYSNDKKLYIAIYPNCNKIAIWNVNSTLFRSSEKEQIEMKRNTCNGYQTKTKLVYRFKLKEAKIFNFNLTEYRNKYNALYKEITQKKNKLLQ